jgi:hypothetical protein
VAGALAVGCLILFYSLLLRVSSWDWALFIIPINQTKTFLVALLSFASGWSAGYTLGAVGSLTLVGIIGGQTVSFGGEFSVLARVSLSTFRYWLFFGLGFALGRPLGDRIGRFMHDAVDEFSAVIPYLRAMWRPVGGFAVGYIMTVVLFGGFFHGSSRQRRRS